MQVLQRLRAETALMRGGQMQVSPDQGQFLAQLAQLTRTRRYLEIGVFTGYSALAVALVLPTDGKVLALDRDKVSTAVATRFWADAGVTDKIDLRLGAAADTLATVAQEYGPQSFDLAFIGAGPLLRLCMPPCACLLYTSPSPRD